MVEYSDIRYYLPFCNGQEDGVEPRKSLRERNVESALLFAGLKPGNSEGLTSSAEVLRRFGLGDSDWPLLLATRVHIESAKAWDDPASLDPIRAIALAVLDEVVAETSYPAPHPPPPLSAPPLQLDVDELLSRYVHARCALAALIEDEDAEEAIQLLEPVLPLVTQGNTDYLPRDINLAERFVAHRLKTLYAKVGRFEQSLRLHLDRWQSVPDSFELARLCLDGLLNQVGGGPTVADAKLILDFALAVLRRSNRVDRNEREDLSQCPSESRQFWAWRYGNLLGELIAGRDHLVQALLQDLKAGQWDGGWPAAPLLIDASLARDWNEYRAHTIGLYNSADYELETPWPSTPSALAVVFRPDSDLWWATRMGMADSFLRMPSSSPVPIVERLETIEHIASTHMHRFLRWEQKQELLLDQIAAQSPETYAETQQRVRAMVGSRFDDLPPGIGESLVRAEIFWTTSLFMDEARVAFSKVAEGLVSWLVADPIRQLGNRGPHLAVPKQNNQQGDYAPNKLHAVSLWQWGAAFLSCVGGNGSAAQPFFEILLQNAPSLDLKRLVDLGAALQRASQLRGSSAHYGTYPLNLDQSTEAARELRGSMFGTDANAGLIAGLLGAFGR